MQRNSEGLILDQQGNRVATGTVIDLGAGGKFYVGSDGKLTANDPNVVPITPSGQLVSPTGSYLSTPIQKQEFTAAANAAGMKEDSTGRLFYANGTVVPVGTIVSSKPGNWGGTTTGYKVAENGRAAFFISIPGVPGFNSGPPEVKQYVGPGIAKAFDFKNRDVNQVLSETLPPLYIDGKKNTNVTLQQIDDAIFRKTLQDGYDPIAAGTKNQNFGNLGFGQAFAGGNVAIPNTKGAGLWAAGLDPNDPTINLRIERWFRENPWGQENVNDFYNTFGIDRATLTNEEKKRYLLEAVDWYFLNKGQMAPVPYGSDEYVAQNINRIHRRTGYVPLPQGTVINGVTLGGGLGARNDNPNTISASYGGLIGIGFDPYDPALWQRLDLTVRNDNKIGGEIGGKLAQYFSKNPKTGTSADLINGMNWYYADLGRRMDKDNSFFGSLVGKIVGIGLTTIAGVINPWLGAAVGAGLGAATGGITGALMGGLGGYGWGNILGKVGINLNNIVKIPIVQKLGILPSPSEAFGAGALQALLSNPVELGKKFAGGLAGVAWDELTEPEKRQMSDLAIEMNVPIAQFKAGMKQPGTTAPASGTTPAPSPAPAPSSTPSVGPRGIVDLSSYALANGLIKRATGGEVRSPWATDLEQLTKGWDQMSGQFDDKMSQGDNNYFISKADQSMTPEGEAKKDYTSLIGATPNALAASGMNSFIKQYG